MFVLPQAAELTHDAVSPLPHKNAVFASVPFMPFDYPSANAERISNLVFYNCEPVAVLYNMEAVMDNDFAFSYTVISRIKLIERTAAYDDFRS